MQPIAQRAMTPDIITKIDEGGITAVLVIDELQHALPLAKALLAGGVNSIELTLRTAAALDAAKLIKKELPEINLGFGTVLTVEQVKAVVDLGADFAVAPGCNPKVIAEAIKADVINEDVAEKIDEIIANATDDNIDVVIEKGFDFITEATTPSKTPKKK